MSVKAEGADIYTLDRSLRPCALADFVTEVEWSQKGSSESMIIPQYVVVSTERQPSASDIVEETPESSVRTEARLGLL
jgi:hypothetical protein